MNKPSTAMGDPPVPRSPADLTRVVGLASTAGAMLAGLCMNLLVAIILGQLIARNLFDAAWPFVLDLGGWLFVALSFLGLGWVMREGAHIRLTLLIDRLSARAQAGWTLVANLASLAFCLFFLISIWRNLAQVYRTGVSAPGALDMPLYPVWAIVLIGMALLVLQTLIEIAANLRALGPPTPAAPEDVSWSG